MEAVSLVGEGDVRDRDPVRFELRHDLVRLVLVHPRIVRALFEWGNFSKFLMNFSTAHSTKPGRSGVADGSERRGRVVTVR